MDVNELLNLAMEKQINGDISGAEKLLMEAAESGSGHAAHNLGVFYITCGEGIDHNLEKARYWLDISLASGFEETIASDPEWFKKDSSKSKD